MELNGIWFDKDARHISLQSVQNGLNQIADSTRHLTVTRSGEKDILRLRLYTRNKEKQRNRCWHLQTNSKQFQYQSHAKQTYSLNERKSSNSKIKFRIVENERSWESILWNRRCSNAKPYYVNRCEQIELKISLRRLFFISFTIKNTFLFYYSPFSTNQIVISKHIRQCLACNSHIVYPNRKMRQLRLPQGSPNACYEFTFWL